MAAGLLAVLHLWVEQDPAHHHHVPHQGGQEPTGRGQAQALRQRGGQSRHGARGDLAAREPRREGALSLNPVLLHGRPEPGASRTHGGLLLPAPSSGSRSARFPQQSADLPQSLPRARERGEPAEEAFDAGGGRLPRRPAAAPAVAPAQIQHGEERLGTLGRAVVVPAQHGAERQQLAVQAPEAAAQQLGGVAAGGDPLVGVPAVDVGPVEEAKRQVAA